LNRDKFVQFEERLFDTIKGRTPLMEVPYYVCFYNPKDEVEVQEEFSNLCRRVKTRGFSSEEISFAKLMIDIMENEGITEVLDNEMQLREDLEKTLRRTLLPEMVKALKERLDGKTVAHCVVLMRYGATWPFLHLSHLLSAIENSVECTLVIPYPSKLGEGRPLDEPNMGIIGYYRCQVVDLR